MIRLIEVAFEPAVKKASAPIPRWRRMTRSTVDTTPQNGPRTPRSTATAVAQDGNELRPLAIKFMLMVNKQIHGHSLCSFSYKMLKFI